MSNIEKLYYNMERLTDNWNDMPETRKAIKKIGRSSWQRVLFKV